MKALKAWGLRCWARVFSKNKQLTAAAQSREIGKRAEQAALRFLQHEKGYRIICKNWRAWCGEIDIICRAGGILIFVEVRARKREAVVNAYYSIGREKRDKLRRTIRLYLRKLRVQPVAFRFDVVAISLYPTGDIEFIHHYSGIPL